MAKELNKQPKGTEQLHKTRPTHRPTPCMEADRQEVSLLGGKSEMSGCRCCGDKLTHRGKSETGLTPHPILKNQVLGI